VTFGTPLLAGIAAAVIGSLPLFGCRIDMSGSTWVLSDETARAMAGSSGRYWTMAELAPDPFGNPIVVCFPAAENERDHGILTVRVPGHFLEGWPEVELDEPQKAVLLSWEVSSISSTQQVVMNPTDPQWAPFEGPAATVYTYIVDLTVAQESEARVRWSARFPANAPSPSSLRRSVAPSLPAGGPP
jgi:hypothetical protein